jgi:hypothetical protein
MRARDEAVSPVSAPEKKNDTSRQNTTAISEKISMDVMAAI